MSDDLRRLQPLPMPALEPWDEEERRYARFGRSAEPVLREIAYHVDYGEDARNALKLLDEEST